MADTDWITRRDAAERLAVSTETVDRYVRIGFIERRKNEVTKAVWLKAADVEAVRVRRLGRAGDATPE